MNDSILKDVKEALGLIVDDASFDKELSIHINAALETIYQNGLGVPIYVSDETQKWSEMFESPSNQNDYMWGMIKQYVFLKTKVLFDPPPPSTVEYVNNAAEEKLWRLREEYDTQKETI